MKKYILFLLPIIILSCNKRYPEPISHNYSNDTCHQEKIYLKNYFNYRVYGADIVSDNNNNLWIATSQGLLKINKNTASHTIYNTSNTILYDNNICSVAIDKSGNLWLLDDYERIYRYQPDANKWNEYKPAPYENTVGANDSTIYTAYENALYKFVDGTWDTIVLPDNLTTFYNGKNIACEDSIFWLATYNGLLKYVNDSNYVLYNTDNSSITDNTVSNIYVDSKKRKWLITDSGVEMFDGDKWYLFDDLTNIYCYKDMVFTNKYFPDSHTYYIYYFQNNFWEPLINSSNCNNPSSIINFTVDNDNAVWIIGRDQIIYKYTNL